MEFTTYSGILTQQVLNENTGELEVKHYREEIKRTKLKGGFAMVYKDYDTILENVITSNMDMKLFQLIKSSFTHARIEVVLSSTTISAKLGISKPKVTRFIKQRLNKLSNIKGQALFDTVKRTIDLVPLLKTIPLSV